MKKNSELAVREMMEVNIPENLEDLKRPALQKLCKRLGLKANGKVLVFVTFSHNGVTHRLVFMGETTVD